MVRNLKWMGAAFEALLGIPALGGLFIISMGYTPLGFIPFLGMMLHWVAAIALVIDALMTPREQIHMTKEDDRF